MVLRKIYVPYRLYENPMITRIIIIDSLCQVVNKILIFYSNKILIFYLLQVSASRPTLFDL